MEDYSRGFLDRTEAGKLLGQNLKKYAGRSDIIVMGLVRGGIPVAYEVARTLNAPLEPLLVRKLGIPGQPEVAMGAIVSGGMRILNQDMIRYYGISDEEVEEETRRQTLELK